MILEKRLFQDYRFFSIYNVYIMPSTKRTLKHRKTRKTNMNSPLRNGLTSFEQNIVIKFLEILNMIKLYHWKHIAMQLIKQPMN